MSTLTTSQALAIQAPLPSPPSAVVLFARMQFRYENKILDAQGKRSVFCDVYDLIIPPTSPLKVGTFVHICGVGPKVPHPCPVHPGPHRRRGAACACAVTEQFCYTAYDAKISGFVKLVNVLDQTCIGDQHNNGPIVEFMVENTHPEASQVKHVVVAATCIHGKTVAADAEWGSGADTLTPQRNPMQFMDWEINIAVLPDW
ncbi:uncharacterized protein BXZ73DRAFT_77900 [Epithele typhae]|uniref:uncharacterized protein n=1 Tax=Epithele typhae TaxID=378194 RepID=UPI002008BB37|nr:uncharacterized protein BXZ73DRAFT_77900 [Epithele typhae]KAH9930454.1 hypothetical protein BXZ73DRAFT_77900 [Epithele typhae]